MQKNQNIIFNFFLTILEPKKFKKVMKVELDLELIT